MQTDITLEQATNHRRIVVDTKFTGILTQGQFGQDTLRSGYLYQIYAYVFSQLALEDLGCVDYGSGPATPCHWRERRRGGNHPGMPVPVHHGRPRWNKFEVSATNCFGW